MQIILLEQVRNLGKVGEVVKVKDGFARNFLLPNKKALRATKSNIDLFEVQKAEINKKNEEQIKQAEIVAKKVDDIIIEVIEQAGEDGRLYGSVNISDISKAVTDKSGQGIERKQIALHDPIKYIGIYEVDVELHAQVVVKVNVNVARTADEAKSAAYKFNKGESVMEGPAAEAGYEEEDIANDEAVAVPEAEEKAESSDEEAA